MVVGGVVDAVVVEPAEGFGFGEVGAAAVGPGVLVMQFGPGVGPVTAVSEAGGVSGGEGDALGFGEEPLGAAEVEGE